MDDLARMALAALEQGDCPVLVSVVSQQGSTPRTAGARMLVGFCSCAEAVPALLTGTVGGGLVEAKAMEAAARCTGYRQAEMLEFDLSGELAAGADMICGGKLTLLVEPLGHEDIPLFQALVRDGEQGVSRYVLSEVTENKRRLGPSWGTSGALKQDSAQAELASLGLSRDQVVLPWHCPPRLILAGGGHVALAVFQVAQVAGFAATVLDDRPEFAAEERFPGAELVRVVPGFIQCFAGLNINADTSVVILTRGHLHDAAVLEQALRTQAGYVGMIGSKRKRDAIYERLLHSGMDHAALARVHCPIGLPLGGQSPGEIAVAIVAEIIQTDVTGH